MSDIIVRFNFVFCSPWCGYSSKYFFSCFLFVFFQHLFAFQTSFPEHSFLAIDLFEQHMRASVITPAYPGHRKKGQNDGNPCVYSEKPTSRRKFLGFPIFYRDFVYFPSFCYIFVGFPINGHPQLELFLQASRSDPPRPPKSLKGFARRPLASLLNNGADYRIPMR